MGRRRKSDGDLLELIIKLGGLVVLLCVITPQGRQTIAALGFIAVCVLGATVVA